MTTLYSTRAGGPFPSCSRKLRGFLALVLACLFTLVGTTLRAQEETGVVTGRVLNAQNGMALPRAVVSVDGTAFEVLTDDFGDFIIRNVPAGERTLVATFTGQEPVSVTVVVPAGGSVSRNLQFNRPPDRREDEEIVLAPFEVNENRYKNAAEIAVNEERYSVNIKNVVSTDAFGDIPTGNVGDFVKFMPGILVSYGGGDSGGQGVSEADPTGISVRGFDAADTAITVDGMPVSSAFPGSLTRQSYLDTMSINNASRVEVTKVPTPDMPANSIGGQVNLVTRNAFEYAKPTYNWSAYLTANSDYMTLSKSPGPIDSATRKVQPAGTFSMSYPFSETLGVSASLSYVPQYKQNQRAQMSTYTRGTPGGLGAMTPEQAAEAYRTTWQNTYRMERYQITDTPQFTTRTSGNIRTDWKPFPGHTLTANFQYSEYESEEGMRRLDYRTGNASYWDEHNVIGQVNSNAPRVAMTVTTRDRIGDSLGGTLTYRIQLGGWDLNLSGYKSVANSEYQDAQNGHFSEVGAITGGQTGANAIQVNFKDISRGVPGYFEVVGTGGTGALRDTTLLSTGWRFDGDYAKSGEAFSKDTVGLYKADVRRELDFLPFADALNLALQVGVRRDEKDIEKWGVGSNYAEEFNAGKSVTFTDLIDTNYVGVSPGYGHPAQEWISSYVLWDLDQEQDLFSVQSESRKINNWNSYVNQTKSIKETKDAWYIRLDGRSFNGRLSWIAGVRQETNSREGFGPYTDTQWNYAKNPDGTVYRDSVYNRVKFSWATDPIFSDAALRARLDAAGAIYPKNPDGTPRLVAASNATGNTPATLEGRQMNLRDKYPVDQKVTGDPSYSVNLSYEVVKNLQAKLGWSRTFGQPPLEDAAGTSGGLLSGNNAFQFTEYDTIQADGVIGQITLSNLALGPEVADNWDIALSYYFNQGGKVSVSYYWKEVTNQIVNYTTYSTDPSFNTVVGAAGVDPADFQDYRLVTKSNGSGTQKTDGYEIEVQQNFAFLGGIGRHFNAFASYTAKGLGDPQPSKPVTVIDANGNPVVVPMTAVKTIRKTADEFAGAGVNFAMRRFSASVRGTYRARNERSTPAAISYTPTGGTPTILNYVRQFDPSETRIDLSVDYRLTEKLSIFANAKDVFRNSRDIYQEDDLGWIPSRARYLDHRRFGVEWTFGVRGTF